jgi:uncharacterized repeat protein (TIGR01451 family)
MNILKRMLFLVISMVCFFEAKAQFVPFQNNLNYGNRQFIEADTIWQATAGGIVKRTINGELLQIFPIMNMPHPASTCEDIVIGLDGAMWVANGTGGVSRFHNGQWQTWALNGYIERIVRSLDGTIWAIPVLLEGHVYKFDGAAFSNILLPTNWQSSASILKDVKIDTHGRLYISNGSEIIRRHNDYWEKSYFAGNNSVYAMAFDANGVLFTTNENGFLLRWEEDLSASTFLTLFISSPQTTPRTMTFDGNGNLWVGCGVPAKLWRWDGTIMHDEMPFPLEDIKHLATDALGHIWMTINNSNEGILRFDGQNWEHFNVGFGLPTANALTGGDKIWTTTKDLITSYNPDNQSFEYIHPFIYNGKKEYFSAVALGQNNRTWIACQTPVLYRIENGVTTRFSDSTTNFGLPSGRIEWFEEDDAGRLWMSVKFQTYHYGITMFDGQNWQTFNTSNSPQLTNKVFGIKKGKHGEMWFSKENGLLKWKDGTWTEYPPNQNIGTIYPEERRITVSDDAVWVLLQGYGIAKVDSTGWQIITPSLGGLADFSTLSDIEIGPDGALWVSSFLGSNTKPTLQRFDGYIWQTWTEMGSANQSSDELRLLETDKKGNFWISNGQQIWMYRPAAQWVYGSIFRDDNLSCERETGEIGIPARIITAENLETHVKTYSTSNANGDFLLNLDSTNYRVFVSTSNSYWEACNDTILLDLSNATLDTTQIEFALQSTANCPRMTVEVATPFLRRCFDNTFYVNWCNLGTDTAFDARVELHFEDDFQFISSTQTPDNQTDISLSFSLGTVAPGACGNLQTKFFLPCDSVQLGERLCLKAAIFPNIFCNTSPQWSGAAIEVSGQCLSDSVKFFIENTGNNPSQSLDYVIIDDHVILRTENITLLPNEIKTETLPADGSFWRIQAEQEPFFPVQSYPSFSIEACGTDTLGNFSSGFAAQYPDDDASPFVDWECREIVGAFDPNDKTGFPLGVKLEHFILPETNIDYLIRFQNTGTDTAFTVVVRDTLSKNLDPASLLMGASSHPLQWDLTDEGILSVKFEHILLPDSNINEAASQGFFRFKISPKKDIVLGAQILNKAAIYFDFNLPVITNETWHTVDTGFLETLIATSIFSDNALKINQLNTFPNPTTEKMEAKWVGENRFLKVLKYTLSRSDGQVVETGDFVNGQCIFPQKQIPNGLYFFVLKNEEGAVLAYEKVVFEHKK